MCGIAGVMLRDMHHATSWREVLERMADAVRHRGPDDGGIWWDAAAGIGLAHRRLSIVDLSPCGHQPMQAQGQRYVIAYNGEIYNYSELADQLDYPWCGHSDTEVLLAAIETWGLSGALERCVGMFAFALWDRHTQRLSLVRDRMGVKPLYIANVPGGVVFGSELKALRAYPGFPSHIDRNALSLLLRHGYIASPHAIYEQTWKVRPGHVLTIDNRSGDQPERWESTPFWSLRSVANNAVRERSDVPDDEVVTGLEDRLTQAVTRRMISDVPIGAFLSGGIDSSTVVALMQARSGHPVRTFSLGTDAHDYNEAPYAKAVAQHLGTEHTEFYVTAREALATIPTLAQVYDEPFADWSQIPTLLISQLARRYVTVALSGDGGDELFLGYARYLFGLRLIKAIGRVPPAGRHILATLLATIPSNTLDRLLRLLRWSLPSGVSRRLRSDNVRTLSRFLHAKTPAQLYQRMVAFDESPTVLVPHSNELHTAFTDADLPSLEFADLMMYLDSIDYLPDDILVKLDRASMSVGLEARNPFLDHTVVEYAWSLPPAVKLRDGIGKWPLRQVLYRYVPRSLVDRPKKGFSLPVSDWLRGPLREWAEAYLHETALAQHGYLNPVPIRKLWTSHLSGRRNHAYLLWNILMFQAWFYDNHIASSSPRVNPPHTETCQASATR